MTTRISKCKYCGKPYTKTENKTAFCSDKCRHKSIQDSKAKYQRKRRLQIKRGTLIERDKQLESIIKERRRIGVK